MDGRRRETVRKASRKKKNFLLHITHCYTQTATNGKKDISWLDSKTKQQSEKEKFWFGLVWSSHHLQKLNSNNSTQMKCGYTGQVTKLHPLPVKGKLKTTLHYTKMVTVKI